MDLHVDNEVDLLGKTPEELTKIFDKRAPWGLIKRVALYPDGEVAWYFDMDDWNYTYEGRPVNWAAFKNGDMNIAIQIPKFYIARVVDKDTNNTILGISMKPVRTEYTEEEDWVVDPAFFRDRTKMYYDKDKDPIEVDYRYILIDFADVNETTGEVSVSPLKKENIKKKYPINQWEDKFTKLGAGYSPMDIHLRSMLDRLMLNEFGNLKTDENINTSAYFASNGSTWFDGMKTGNYRGLVNPYGENPYLLEGIEAVDEETIRIVKPGHVKINGEGTYVEVPYHKKNVTDITNDPDKWFLPTSTEPVIGGEGLGSIFAGISPNSKVTAGGYSREVFYPSAGYTDYVHHTIKGAIPPTNPDDSKPTVKLSGDAIPILSPNKEKWLLRYSLGNGSITDKVLSARTGETLEDIQFNVSDGSVIGWSKDNNILKAPEPISLALAEYRPDGTKIRDVHYADNPKCQEVSQLGFPVGSPVFDKDNEILMFIDKAYNKVKLKRTEEGSFKHLQSSKANTTYSYCTDFDDSSFIYAGWYANGEVTVAKQRIEDDELLESYSFRPSAGVVKVIPNPNMQVAYLFYSDRIEARDIPSGTILEKLEYDNAKYMTSDPVRVSYSESLDTCLINVVSSTYGVVRYFALPLDSETGVIDGTVAYEGGDSALLDPKTSSLYTVLFNKGYTNLAIVNIRRVSRVKGGFSYEVVKKLDKISHKTNATGGVLGWFDEDHIIDCRAIPFHKYNVRTGEAVVYPDIGNWVTDNAICSFNYVPGTDYLIETKGHMTDIRLKSKNEIVALSMIEAYKYKKPDPTQFSSNPPIYFRGGSHGLVWDSEIERPRVIIDSGSYRADGYPGIIYVSATRDKVAMGLWYYASTSSRGNLCAIFGDRIKNEGLAIPIGKGWKMGYDGIYTGISPNGKYAFASALGYISGNTTGYETWVVDMDKMEVIKRFIGFKTEQGSAYPYGIDGGVATFVSNTEILSKVTKHTVAVIYDIEMDTFNRLPNYTKILPARPLPPLELSNFTDTYTYVTY